MTIRTAAPFVALVALPLVLLAAAPVASSAPREPSYRLSARSAAFDDPGVIAVFAPDGTPPITRVTFGGLESPSIGPWTSALGGQSVAVPPGRAGQRASVVIHIEDGSMRRLGAFAWTDPTARDRIDTGSGRGCPSGSVGTYSSARKISRTRFRYTYEVRNEMPGAVTVQWPVLRHLGLAGGLTVTVPANQTYKVSRVAPGSPVEVPDVASSDTMPGCAPTESGVSWSAPALFPASELPVVIAPTDVTVSVDVDGRATIGWSYDGAAPAPDDFQVTSRSVVQNFAQVAGPGRRGPPVFPFSDTKPAGDGTARSLVVYLAVPGATTVSVRAIRNGVSSAPALASTIR